MKTEFPLKYILCFSLYTNTLKTLSTSQPPGAIGCLNGIRVFLMTWVILLHSFLPNFMLISDYPQLLTNLMSQPATRVMLSLFPPIDSFFYLGGFLVAYHQLKKLTETKPKVSSFFKSLPTLYLQRYIRLTPAYAFMILIWTSLMWYVWDGPYWPIPNPVRTMADTCVDKWYLNILYVNNLFNPWFSCAGWSWYLANDMQYFLIAPFIVYAFYKSPKIGTAVCSGTILISTMASIGVSHQQGYPFVVGAFANYTFKTSIYLAGSPFYFAPWVRYQPYGVGLLSGFAVWKLKDMKYKLPQKYNILLWCAATCLCVSVVYAPHAAFMGHHVISMAENDIYNGFARLAWTVAASCVVISCSLGQGGWINEFLSWKGFVPLGKLSYCVYLIHLPIMTVLVYGIRTGTYYSTLMFTKDVIAAIAFSYLMAIPFSLLFEVPFSNFYKLIPTAQQLKMKIVGKAKDPSENCSAEQHIDVSLHSINH